MDYQNTFSSDQLLFVSKYLDSYVPTSSALSYIDIVLLTRQKPSEQNERLIKVKQIINR